MQLRGNQQCCRPTGVAGALLYSINPGEYATLIGGPFYRPRAKYLRTQKEALISCLLLIRCEISSAWSKQGNSGSTQWRLPVVWRHLGSQGKAPRKDFAPQPVARRRRWAPGCCAPQHAFPYITHSAAACHSDTLPSLLFLTTHICSIINPDYSVNFTRSEQLSHQIQPPNQTL
jgi:hypothetical protein